MPAIDSSSSAQLGRREPVMTGPAGFETYAEAYVQDIETQLVRSEELRAALQTALEEAQREREDTDWKAARYDELISDDGSQTWTLERVNADLQRQLEAAQAELTAVKAELARGEEHPVGSMAVRLGVQANEIADLKEALRLAEAAAGQYETGLSKIADMTRSNFHKPSRTALAIHAVAADALTLQDGKAVT